MAASRHDVAVEKDLGTRRVVDVAGELDWFAVQVPRFVRSRYHRCIGGPHHDLRRGRYGGEQEEHDNPGQHLDLRKAEFTKRVPGILCRIEERAVLITGAPFSTSGCWLPR